MNEKLRRALESGEYYCPECGKLMVFDDEEWRDSLVCEGCGYSCALDNYGLEDGEIAVGECPTGEAPYEDIYGDDDD